MRSIHRKPSDPHNPVIGPPPRFDVIDLIARVAVLVALLYVLALIIAPVSVGATGRPPRPCIGVVVKAIEGVEYVRRRDGTACTRPATVRPTATARRVGR